MFSFRIWLRWSFEQVCFHVEEEARGLEINLTAFAQNRAVSYVPIAVFSTFDEACACADKLRALAEERAHEHARQQEHQMEAHR